jgi:hypothetical protein
MGFLLKTYLCDPLYSQEIVNTCKNGSEMSFGKLYGSIRDRLSVLIILNEQCYGTSLGIEKHGNGYLMKLYEALMQRVPFLKLGVDPWKEAISFRVLARMMNTKAHFAWFVRAEQLLLRLRLQTFPCQRQLFAAKLNIDADINILANTFMELMIKKLYPLISVSSSDEQLAEMRKRLISLPVLVTPLLFAYLWEKRLLPQCILKAIDSKTRSYGDVSTVADFLFGIGLPATMINKYVPLYQSGVVVRPSCYCGTMALLHLCPQVDIEDLENPMLTSSQTRDIQMHRIRGKCLRCEFSRHHISTEVTDTYSGDDFSSAPELIALILNIVDR